MHGYFVTGTDTGVGKTVLSAALAIRLKATYWKPIQTGREDDTAEVHWLSGCEVIQEGIRLESPVSPHLAAERQGTRIDLSTIANIWTGFSSQITIVEGAGGVLVPVNETDMMVDLMKLLELPIIVAARATLGTINHTLLTLEALRTRSLNIAGVVMIGEHDPDNHRAIEHYGNVTVLAEMPNFDPLTPETLREWAQSHLHLPHHQNISE